MMTHSQTLDDAEGVIRQLLKQLVDAVGTSHAPELLWEAVWLIEDRLAVQGRTNTGSSRNDPVWDALREALNSLIKDPPPSSSPTGTSSVGDRTIYHQLAIELIDALVAVKYAEKNQRSLWLMKYLFLLLKNGRISTCQAAVGIMRRLFKADRTPEMKNLLQNEMKDSCEAMRKEFSSSGGQRTQLRSTSSVLGGVLLCELLLTTTPRVLSTLRREVIEVIMMACGAPQQDLRQLAVQCFSTIVATSGFFSNSELSRLVEDARRAVDALPNDSTVISYMGVLQTLLQQSDRVDHLQKPILHLCQIVLRVHKTRGVSVPVRLAIESAMPRMAKYDSDRRSHYVGTLIELLKNTRGDPMERTGQLARVAELIRLVGYGALVEAERRNVETLVTSMVLSKTPAWPSVVEEGWDLIAAIELELKAEPNHSFHTSVRQCAVEGLHRARLSASLVSSITKVQQAVPSSAATLQQHLNNLILDVLRVANQEDGLTSSPAHGTTTTTTGGQAEGRKPAGLLSRIQFWKDMRETSSDRHDGPTTDEESVVAALAFQRELKPKEVSAVADQMRVNDVPLLRHANPAIRRASAITIVDRMLYCEELLATVADQKNDRPKLVELTECYLRMVLLESDPMLRLEQLRRLDRKRLYRTLGDEQCLPHLYSILHESLRIREVVLTMLCGIAKSQDNTTIISELMLIVHSIVLTLEHTSNASLIYSHLRDLACFTAADPKVFEPDLRRMISIISKHLEAYHGTSTSAVIMSYSALTALSRVVALFRRSEAAIASVKEELTALAPKLLAVVADATTVVTIRHMAMKTLQTLYSIGSFTPTIVELSSWIDGISQIYMSTTSSEGTVRNDVMSCFGVLGAIDPQKFRHLDDEAQRGNTKANELYIIGDEPTVSNDYGNVVYHALINMLSEPLVEGITILTLRTLVKVVRGTKDHTSPGLRAARTIIALIHKVESAAVMEEGLAALAAIIVDRRDAIVDKLLGEVVGALEASWCFVESNTTAAPPSSAVGTAQGGKNTLLSALVEVVESLTPGKLSVQVQEERCPWLYAKLVDVISANADSDEMLVLRIIAMFRGTPTDIIPPHGVLLILPCLTQLISDTHFSPRLRCQAIVAAVHIACRQKLTRFLFPLLQSLRIVARHLPDDVTLAANIHERRESIKALQQGFPSAERTVQQILTDCESMASEHVEAFMTIASQITLTEDPQFLASEQLMPRVISQADTFGGDAVIDHLLKGSNGAVSDWRKWFSHLETLVITSSPHKCFRDCALLCERYERLKDELFPSAFLCIHSLLGTTDRPVADAAILNALAQNVHSSYASTCLALADYVDHGANFKFEGYGSEYGSSLQSPGYGRGRGSRGLGSASGHQAMVAEGIRREDDAAGFDGGSMDDDSYNGLDASSPTTLAEAARWAILRRPMSSIDFGASASLEGGSSPKQYRQDTSPLPVTTKLLMFSVDELAQLASKNQLHSKAIRYQELNVRGLGMHNSESRSAVETLAEMYRAQGHFSSVVGLLEEVAQDCTYKDPTNNATTAELLRDWSAANEAYAAMFDVEHLAEAPADAVEGYGRTLNDTARWGDVLALARQVSRFTSPNPPQHGGPSSPLTLSIDGGRPKSTSTSPGSGAGLPLSARIAPHACLAAWSLGNWDEMGRYVHWMDSSSPNMPLFTAVLLFHQASKEELLNTTRSARQMLEESFNTLLPISYSQAYECITKLQHYQELDEALEYGSASPARKEQLRKCWRTRFFALKPNDLHPMLFSLGIRSLVVRPLEMADCWLHFAKNALRTHSELAHWAASTVRAASVSSPLVTSDHTQVVFPSVPVTTTTSPSQRQQGRSPSSAEAVPASSSTTPSSRGTSPQQMLSIQKIPRQFRLDLLQFEWDANIVSKATIVEALQQTVVGVSGEGPDRTLHGQMRLQLGLWKQQLSPTKFWLPPHREDLLTDFLTAVEALPSNHQAWHEWGLLNYRVQQRSEGLPQSERQRFMRAASNAFVAAICRTSSITEALQDVLRLLQLWIRYQGAECLQERMEDSIQRISVDFWAFVVPQLIAYLGDDNATIRRAMTSILSSVCRQHPQSVIFPLLVPCIAGITGEAASGSRAEVAQAILDEECPSRLYQEAHNVASCLIDAAATPLENIRELIGNLIRPLRDGVPADRDDYTAARKLQQMYSKVLSHDLPDLDDYLTAIEACFDNDDDDGIDTAARLIYKQACAALNHVNTIYFSRGLVKLHTTKDLCVCIPGEYQPGQCEGATPTISSFGENLTVIPSKHRPRKLRLQGSDGHTYAFLLKANEDVRMDERVMQLFMLVNSQLISNRQVTIVTRFPVVPLSSRVGLLGWVEGTETLLTRIQRHRRHMQMELNLEHKRGLAEIDDASALTLPHQLEVFLNARGQEPKEDLAQQLWLAAENAEKWLSRRSTFTRSLAVMSMIGYVLGLGDRHLGNLLMKTTTGQIVHVDFGDCFDVARDRTRYPETVPFRLTPMLTASMEVMGASGLFRSTATSTMQLLRANSDAIIALLSTFIHDPIVSLRLTDQQQQQHHMMLSSAVMPRVTSVAAAHGGANAMPHAGPEQLVERLRAKLHGVEFVELSEINVGGTTSTRPRLPCRPDRQYSVSMVTGGRSSQPPTTVSSQVKVLIDQALSPANLSVLYPGWEPWW